MGRQALTQVLLPYATTGATAACFQWDGNSR